MTRSRNLLLTAVLFFLAFALIIILNWRIEEEATQGGITQQEITIEETKEETIKEETTGEETRQQEVKAGETEKLEKLENCQESNWQWLEGQKKIYQLRPEELSLFLKELQQKFPEKQERLKALAILRLGTPYQLGPLGEEKDRDKDPIFRLDVTDCTAFILTTTALLHSSTIENAREIMKFLNYYSEKITFESRLHFTTDRNEVSSYFKDITKEAVQVDKIKQKKLILNKIKEDGKRLIDIDWEKSITLNYISYSHITREFLEELPEAVGIAFIRENDAGIGLDVAHEGFLFNGETLIHASSIQGKVIEENFLDYYFSNQNVPRFEGIILFEVN